MTTRELGALAALRRYPVKSMLGEDLDAVGFTTAGVDRDRELALVDVESGRVATAKHPARWRRLLQFTATTDGDTVRITLPDGGVLDAADDAADDVLSGELGRAVHLTAVREPGAVVERPAPEDTIAHGADADVPYELLEIGQEATAGSFVDYAPVHLITTATLDRIGAEWVRYRPNLVVETPGAEPFAENGWIGREITVGAVRLRGLLPTPRCSVPTLEHGALPRDVHAVRALLDGNRVELPWGDKQPCAGLYAEVLAGGTVRAGDPVTLA